MNKLAALASGLLISLSIAVSAQAAGIYDPVIQVNDKVVTKFEIDQRVKMLRAFETPGDIRQQAMDQLIDDRLRNQAAKQFGISISGEDVFSGMEEFAARGNFSADQLLEFFRQQGVYRETFEDFVRSGLLWRNVVGARFSSKVNITDDEVDTNLDISSISFPKTVNVAEIIIPINDRGATKTLALANRLSETIKNSSQFGIAARKYSKSATAVQGGAMGWVPLGNLPAQVSSHLSGMTAGQVTAPINIGSAIAVYQLLGIREAKSAGQQVIAVSYMQVALPSNSAGRDGQISAAIKLINSGDTCLDMQANASDFGENAFSSHTVPASDIPVRIGAEIARLDPNEATYFVTDTGTINIVMLCNRAKDLPEGARDQIRNALFNQRVTSFGDGYLQELRGDAIIIRK
jgi:peptidyl-prolyl cis-trans isomerase SurA